MELTNFEVSKKLKEKGFDEGCEYTYYNHYRVRDEILEKHQGLSDCGYIELLKENGGIYTRKELFGYYTEALKLWSRNSHIGINPITKTKVATSEICSAPTIPQALEWLRSQKSIHISTKPYPCEDGLKWMYEIRKFSHVLVSVIENKTGFNTPEQAENAGIEIVLDKWV